MMYKIFALTGALVFFGTSHQTITGPTDAEKKQQAALEKKRQDFVSEIKSNPQFKMINEQADELFRNKTGIHTKVFSKDNLIANRLSGEEKKNWRDLIYTIDTYIQENREPLLASQMATITKVSDSLLQSLQDTYTKFIEPAVLNKSAGLSGSPFDVKKVDVCKLKNITSLENTVKSFISKNIGFLQSLDPSLKSFQDGVVQKYRAAQNKKNQNDMQSYAKKFYQAELVKRLALFIELTITKLGTDVAKIKSAVAQNSSQCQKK